MKQVTLTIDDQQVTVNEGTTVLEAAKNLNVNIPHYCYHPGLSIAGNCRMCLVEIEKFPKPAIGCNTVCTEGMVVKTQTEKVKKMQQSVMEFLLINHPLDCPTCDQAGECRLQDYYMQYDEIPSRFKETKVHKDKMVDLGSDVMLDQERCIACTRCIRFCKEIAGEDELALSYRGDHVTITTFPGKELSNPYAGNVVDICPVGALTNKDFRYKKRVWFLKKTPSVCTGCATGCNIDINHADNKVFRYVPRFNEKVNQYWMCDEGRFSYKFINENRLLRPQIAVENEFQEVLYDEAIQSLASRLRDYPAESIGLVAHAALTNENLKLIVDLAAHLKTKHLYFSRNEPKNPFSDDILISADKNPNQTTVDLMGFKPLARATNDVKALIVFHDLSESDQLWVAEKKWPILGLLASNNVSFQKKCSVLLPIPTFAEQDGSFTNKQGLTQKISKAIELRGESKPLEWVIGQLSVSFSGDSLLTRRRA